MSNKPNVKELKTIINRIKNINIKIYSKTLNEKEDYFFKNHPDIMNNYPFSCFTNMFWKRFRKTRLYAK